MNKLPTQDEIKHQAAMYGQFVISYEKVCSMIRFIILKVCYPEYTAVQNNNVETLLEGLTADPLRKKLEALIHDNYNKDKQLLELNKKLSNIFSSFMAIRNSLVHGSTLLGYNGFNGELSSQTFLLKHTKTTKTGIDRNSMIIKVETLEVLIKKLNQIDNAYVTLCAVIDTFNIQESRMINLENLKNTIANIGNVKLEFEKKISK